MTRQVDDVPHRRGHQNAAYAAQHAAIIAEATHPNHDLKISQVAGATKLGDPRKLRGIPCIARGVGGTSPGTNPDRITNQRTMRP